MEVLLKIGKQTLFFCRLLVIYLIIYLFIYLFMLALAKMYVKFNTDSEYVYF